MSEQKAARVRELISAHFAQYDPKTVQKAGEVALLCYREGHFAGIRMHELDEVAGGNLISFAWAHYKV